MNVQCDVINPISIFDIRKGNLDPEISFDHTIKANPIKLMRPRYISFSKKKLFIYNTAHLTQSSFERTVCSALSHLGSPPGFLYGHFLYQSGAAAVRIGHKLGIPSIVAVGDSSFWGVEPIGYRTAINDFKEANGMLAVSGAVKRALIGELKIPEEKIQVFPNGVDLTLFYPRHRSEMRKKYNLPIHKFIVAFVGHFDERKGPHRLLTAVSGMENIGLIFIGSGSIPLKSKDILFKGIMEHEKIPEILSAADIFVLPTVAEGSCNAILEALACGLPVVTSREAFNDDIVDDNVSIRIDSLNIGEIRSAIVRLRNNYDLRKEMSLKALEKIEQYDINLRARKILSWMMTIRQNHLNR